MTDGNGRYWADMKRPATKREFFNAVTTPTPAGDGTIATIRLYGPVDSWGGFWGISAKDVGQVLDALPESVDRIVLRINSPGGEVWEGLAILNMLRAHKATVTAVVDGIAASAASMIAAGFDDTVMSPGTQMMIHSPSTFTWGSAADLRKDAEILDTIERGIVEIYQAKAGEKDWPALLEEETWMTAQETVAFGLADRVAVIPDAGETHTAGDDPVLIVVDEPDDNADDIVSRMRVPLHDRPAARAFQTPVSTEPVDIKQQKEDLVGYEDLKAGLRERLGVTDADASDVTLLGALDIQMTSEPTDTITPPAPVVPEGTQLIDSGVLATLQSDAEQGRIAREEQVSARRDAIVATALQEGRITPSSQQAWRDQLDTNEEGTVTLLKSLAANSAVPVTEIGNQPAEASADDAAFYALFPDERPTAAKEA